MADSFSLLSFSTGTGPERAGTPSTWNDGDTDEYEWVHEGNVGDDGDESDTSSLSHTSASPSIHRHEYDHGRRYHSFRSGRYPLPNDTQEQNLEELKHHVMMELTGGRPFLADSGTDPNKIMDVGTGTGTWAIDIADLYPNSFVVGTDLSPIQPSALPLNCQMFIDDCEADWAHEDDFDLIHLRNMAGVLRNLDSMIGKVYANLKPGGWIELQEFLPEICCDDDSMGTDDPIRAFFQISADGMRELGCTNFGSRDTQGVLERAGFVNIQCVTKKIPITPWVKDEHLKYLGGLMKVVVEESLGAYAAKPLDAMGIPLAERKTLVASVKSSLKDLRIHRYIKVQFCYGQKEG